MSNDSDESSNSHLPPVPIALVTQRFNNIKLENNKNNQQNLQQFYNKQFSTNQTTPRNSTSSSTQLASQTPLDNSTNKNNNNCQTKVTRKIPPNIIMSNSDTSSSQGLSSDLSSSGINSGENTCNSGVSGNISKLKPLKPSLKQNEQNVISRVPENNSSLIPELRLQKSTPENTTQNFQNYNNSTITPVQKRNYGCSRMSQSSNNPRPMSIAIDERNLNTTHFNSSNPNTPNIIMNSSMHDLTDPRKFRDDTGFSINMVEEGKQQQNQQQVQFRKKANNHNPSTTPMGSIAKGYPEPYQRPYSVMAAPTFQNHQFTPPIQNYNSPPTFQQDQVVSKRHSTASSNTHIHSSSGISGSFTPIYNNPTVPTFYEDRPIFENRSFEPRPTSYERTPSVRKSSTPAPPGSTMGSIHGTYTVQRRGNLPRPASMYAGANDPIFQELALYQQTHQLQQIHTTQNSSTINSQIQAQSMMNIFDGEVSTSKSSKSKNIFKRATKGFKKFLSASRQSLSSPQEKDEKIYSKKSPKSPKHFKTPRKPSEISVDVPISENYQPYGSNRTIGFSLGKIPTMIGVFITDISSKQQFSNVLHIGDQLLEVDQRDVVSYTLVQLTGMLSSNPRSLLKVRQARIQKRSNNNSLNETVVASVPEPVKSNPVPVYQRTNSYVARQRAQSNYLPIHEETSHEIQAGTLDKNRNKNPSQSLNNNNNNNNRMVKSATADAIGSYDDAQVYL